MYEQGFSFLSSVELKNHPFSAFQIFVRSILAAGYPCAKARFVHWHEGSFLEPLSLPYFELFRDSGSRE